MKKELRKALTHKMYKEQLEEEEMKIIKKEVLKKK